MTGIARVTAGAVVKLDDGREYMVLRFESAATVALRDLESNVVRSTALAEIRCKVPATRRQKIDLAAIPDARLDGAQVRYSVIKPLLDAGGWTTEDVEKAANKGGVSRATIYRWLKQFQEGSLVSSLMRKKRSDAGLTRLSEDLEKVIADVIGDYWLTAEKRTPGAAYTELKRLCRAHRPRLTPPSITTMLARMDAMDAKVVAAKRGGQAAADKLELLKGTVPFADRPYGVIQIDHTPVDVHLVDEEHRVCIGRPWLTLAIDVNSRMVAGYYVSFDPPGTLGTGICIANAMLSKEAMMARLGLKFDYPCMGKPHIIHADNAKEFHGKTLELACNEYSIDLIFRKIKKPRYGAHIERYLGTLLQWIKTLKGTSFSNVEERGDYDSEGRAVMALSDFEKWLANLICGYYHNDEHSALEGRSPLAAYKRGVLGDGASLAAGVIDVVTDEERLRIDFLPLFEMTVQPYGIRIDHVFYQSDVLRRWVGAKDLKKRTLKRKFICRRDPRDISIIYFFDPDAETYFEIPYRDKSRPAISLWELNAARKHLLEQGRKQLDEDALFEALDEMRKIEDEAEKKTKKAKASTAQRKRWRRRDSPQPPKKDEGQSPDATPGASMEEPKGESMPPDVEPYDEVEWL